MNIPFTKHTLDNGVDILLHEDHACPIVAVNLWYHVGSKNETPGHTGFAHLFEHLMFEGSQHHDHGYFQPLQGAGATLNGSTNADRTNYWEVVPAGALERLEEPVIVVLGALEHQMLEQVGKAGVAGALVLRADVIPEVDRDDRARVVFVEQEVQAVVQRVAGEGNVHRKLPQVCMLLP